MHPRCGRPLVGGYAQTAAGTAAEANTERGKNGIIHAMKLHAKTALSLALAIVGGIAAGMRCDASVTVETSTQFNPRPAAYTVKAYTEGSCLTEIW